jgi:3-oxoacyl-[acyl-carrier protein] reductase
VYENGGELSKSLLLEGKRALVTGANKGIGLEITRTFARQGAEVIACVREINSAVTELFSELAIETNSTITLRELDLGDVNSIKQITSKLLQEGTTIQILVNNAGFAEGSRFQLMPSSQMSRAMQINFAGPALLTQRLIKVMSQATSVSAASIINISTSSVKFPGIGMTAYSASKSAMEQSSIVLAKELAKSNVRVNVIAPGPVNTDMLEKMDIESKLDLINSTWMKRPGNSQEIASVALFLASEMSSYITGQVIHVNGGMG